MKIRTLLIRRGWSSSGRRSLGLLVLTALAIVPTVSVAFAALGDGETAQVPVQTAPSPGSSPVTVDPAALTASFKSAIDTMAYWLNVANGTPSACSDPCERDEDFVDAVDGMLLFCSKLEPTSLSQWPGYTQKDHSALVGALVNSCGALETGVAANGSVTESAVWKTVVAQALQSLSAGR